MEYMEVTGAEEKKHSKKPLIVMGVLLAVLAAGYIGLCAYASSLHTFYPNQAINGVDVGGLTASQAESRLKQKIPKQRLPIFLSAEPQEDAAPNAAIFYEELGVTSDMDYHASAFFDSQQAASFFKKGFSYAASLMNLRNGGFANLTPDEERFSAAVDDLAQALSLPPVDGGYSIGENALEITVAKDGREVSSAALKQAIYTAINTPPVGQGAYCGAAVLPAKILTAQEIYDEVSGEMKNAGYDPETKTITPEQLGANFDVARAQQLMDAADPGETVEIAAEIQQPTVTAAELKKVLFRDVLGKATTHVGGTAARKNNVALSSSAVNGVVLNAGETFSYNETTGQRTIAKGYQAAPAYVKGETVDEIGGGVCQPSSTLYLATLNANLEITERYAHRYVPAYITKGMDATVSWGGPDYKFTNNTDYPIKIQAVYAKGYLTMSILGTKTDDVTVKMTYEPLSTTPPTVVYEDDPSLPAGTETVKTTPYTGYKVKSYRNLYDGSGKLISSTYEATSDYKVRNKVIQRGPAAVTPTVPAGSTDPSIPSAPDSPVISPLPPVTAPIDPAAPAAPESETPLAPVDPGITESGEIVDSPALMD